MSADMYAAVVLYRNGATMAKIGRRFGVSRERVRQLLVAYESEMRDPVERRPGGVPAAPTICGHCGAPKSNRGLRYCCAGCKLAASRAAKRSVRIEEAIRLVMAGATLTEAARRVGMASGAQQVWTAMSRRGLRAPPTVRAKCCSCGKHFETERTTGKRKYCRAPCAPPSFRIPRTHALDHDCVVSAREGNQGRKVQRSSEPTCLRCAGRKR